MNSIKDIEVNNRFVRSDNMISLKSEDRNIFLFPIKDIYLDTTFYYLYKGYNSILIYGPKLDDYENMDISKTAIFTEEHNRLLYKRFTCIQESYRRNKRQYIAI